MGNRTHLTSPPGQTPELMSDVATELYTPGLAIPSEPTHPRRNQGILLAVGFLVVLVLGAFVAFQLITSGQDFDPSLDVRNPESEFDPTIPGPGEG